MMELAVKEYGVLDHLTEDVEPVTPTLSGA
jgi:hypothetical protein